MNFEKYLKNSAIEINKEVNKILEKELQLAKQTDGKLVPLLKAFIKSCQGGKGVRGSLVVLGYQLAAHPRGVSKACDLTVFKVHLGGEILKVAAAYEIMHSAILAHDDIMDQSLTRRDKPSLYAELGNNHYGVSQAISLGDWGFFLAFKVISESKFDVVRKNDALTLFARIMMDTGIGQILDLQKASPLLVMKFKTAYYTIAGPLQVGAILGGATRKRVEALRVFGENLGIVYQIRDDVLDNDSSGTIGVGNAEKEMQSYKGQALKVLPNISKDKIMSKLLEQMVEFLINRKK